MDEQMKGWLDKDIAGSPGAMFLATYSWHRAMQIGGKLHRVQMPPV